MIKIYTDVSTRGGNAVATCFITSTTNFIGYRIFEYTQICSALQGELLGIRDGLQYLQSLDISDREVLLYCDSQAALDQINGVSKTPMFKTLISDIQKECSDLDIKFYYIQGHQRSHNPNKVVDLISKSALGFKHPVNSNK